MAAPLVDLATLDLTEDVLADAAIRKLIPHDHEFRMIDGVCHLDLEAELIVCYKVWDENPWWARGHIPGRPLMPGVLMIEGAAQTATLLLKQLEDWARERFVGLAGCNKVRFRRTITPPAKIYFVSKAGSKGRRLVLYPTQCFYEGQMVMDMELVGAPF
jgi:3-hydroxyacyl-[acyl-carrier-protein] dehydratase